MKFDFEEITDTFEDGFDNVKEFTKKNKVFVILLICVGAYALYRLYKRKTSQDTEYVSTYAYVPTAYDGYPTAPESLDYDTMFDQLRTENNEINEDFFNEVMSGVTQVVEGAITDMETKYENIVDTVKDKNTTTTIIYDSSGSYIEEQRIKEQMQENSEAWHTASDEEKKVLEQENQKLGASIGATFDSDTGTWSKDGESLYNVSVKNNTNTSTANLTNVGVSENKMSDTEILTQMQFNSEAWHTASDTEKKRLEQENQKLGASLGATFDSGTGTWSKNGSQLYKPVTGTLKVGNDRFK